MNRRSLLKSLVAIAVAPASAFSKISKVPKYLRRGKLFEVTISKPLTAIAKPRTFWVTEEMMKDCVVFYDTNASFLTEFETHA